MTLLLFLPLLLLLFFLRGFFFFFFFFLCSFLSSVFGPGWPWPAHCGRLAVAVAVAVAGWPEAKKSIVQERMNDESTCKFG